MSAPQFNYITYIYGGQVSAQRVYDALTQREHMDIYLQGSGPKSSWVPGEKVLWKSMPGDDFEDMDQVVLQAVPGKLLQYTWHPIQEMHRGLFDSDEAFEEALSERSKVTFHISPLADGLVGARLQLVHDGFDSVDSVMLHGVTEGWSMILSSLKTYLELPVDQVS